MQNKKIERENVIPLLSIKDLKTYFRTDNGLVKAVDGASLHIREKEILGVVGESGSGKSITAMSVLRLIPSPPGFIAGGDILFRNESLLTKSQKEMRQIRGKDISMIFQEPMSSLNPAYTVGYQIMENIMLHQSVSKQEALNRAVEMLKLVGIPSPEKRVHDYPFQMSGGMRQRVMIAMALSCHPTLLIADEPTGNLDPDTSWELMNLLSEINKTDTTIIMATHAREIVDSMKRRVIAMSDGRISRDEESGVYSSEL